MKLKKFNFTTIKSTNDFAIRVIRNSNIKSGIVIAEKQINGRGQYGKKWISYNGNLFVSFFHELKNINVNISDLTKINCSLVKKLLTNYYKKNITIKKPNDLLINKKKISGILQEIVSIFNKKFLIIGICINIIKSPKIVNYPTTNLEELTNKTFRKADIENKLKLIFEKNLSKMYKMDNRSNK